LESSGFLCLAFGAHAWRDLNEKERDDGNAGIRHGRQHLAGVTDMVFMSGMMITSNLHPTMAAAMCGL
jgi:hypothetical protein